MTGVIDREAATRLGEYRIDGVNGRRTATVSSSDILPVGSGKAVKTAEWPPVRSVDPPPLGPA